VRVSLRHKPTLFSLRIGDGHETDRFARYDRFFVRDRSVVVGRSLRRCRPTNAFAAFLMYAPIVPTSPHRQPRSPAKKPSSLAIPRFQLLIQRAERSRWPISKTRKASRWCLSGIDCPLANLYVLRLAELRASSGRRACRFLAINSNSQDRPRHCKARSSIAGSRFPCCSTAAARGRPVQGRAHARGVGARRFARGALPWPDRRSVCGWRGSPAPTRHDLKEAIKDVLAGSRCASPRRGAGCRIGRAPARCRSPRHYTRTSRLFAEALSGMHRPGQVAPSPC